MKKIVLFFVISLVLLNGIGCNNEKSIEGTKTIDKKVTTNKSQDKEELPEYSPEIGEIAFTTDESTVFEGMTDGCSWYCSGVDVRVEASSYLKSKDKLSYEATNAHDSDLNTSWVEGVNGYGIGEYLKYTFRIDRDGLTLNGVEIYNGYRKSSKLWEENSRVKKMKVLVDGKPYAILLLRDVPESQKFYFNDIALKANKDLIVKFEILDIFQGSKYADTSISEMLFDGTGAH